MLLKRDNTLVGVDHLLEIDRPVGYMRKLGIGIKVLVELDGLVERH